MTDTTLITAVHSGEPTPARMGAVPGLFHLILPPGLFDDAASWPEPFPIDDIDDPYPWWMSSGRGAATLGR